MTPEQLVEIRDKIQRAKSICEDLQTIERLLNSRNQTSEIRTFSGTLYTDKYMTQKIVEHGLKAYKTALEAELRSININTEPPKEVYSDGSSGPVEF